MRKEKKVGEKSTPPHPPPKKSLLKILQMKKWTTDKIEIFTVAGQTVDYPAISLEQK